MTGNPFEIQFKHLFLILKLHILIIILNGILILMLNWYLWHINIKSLPYAFLIIKKLFFIFRLFLRFYRRKVFKVLPWFILADFLFIAAILETVHILERTFWLQKFQCLFDLMLILRFWLNWYLLFVLLVKMALQSFCWLLLDLNSSDCIQIFFSFCILRCLGFWLLDFGIGQLFQFLDFFHI